jgi:O-antigen/teichoic acid export membrane protein
MTVASLFSRYRSWAFKGGFSILDQGFFSGSNFIISILLARWLTLNDYGAFVIAFTFCLLLTGFYNAFILEPMSVLGPGKYSEQLSDYLFIQLKLHGIITFILALVIIVMGWSMAHWINSSLGNAFMGMGFAIPFLLLLWIARRIFYILMKPGYASLISVSFFILSIIGIIILKSTELLNTFTCYIVLGIASIISSIFLFWKNSNLPRNRNRSDLSWQSLVKEQWLYGRWLAAATVLTFLGNQIQVFLLAGLISLQSAGALDALQNFIGPISQGITAITTLAIPILSYDFGRSNFSDIRHKTISVAVLLTIVAGAYEILLWGFSSQLETLIYNGKYSTYVHFIPILGIIPIFTALTTGFSLALRAIQRPQFFLIYGMVVAPVGLLTGVLFTHIWGLEGAVWSLVIISGITLVVHMILYRNWFINSIIRKQVTNESN